MYVRAYVSVTSPYTKSSWNDLAQMITIIKQYVGYMTLVYIPKYKVTH